MLYACKYLVFVWRTARQCHGMEFSKMECIFCSICMFVVQPAVCWPQWTWLGMWLAKSASSDSRDLHICRCFAQTLSAKESEGSAAQNRQRMHWTQTIEVVSMQKSWHVTGWTQRIEALQLSHTVLLQSLHEEHLIAEESKCGSVKPVWKVAVLKNGFEINNSCSFTCSFWSLWRFWTGTMGAAKGTTLWLTIHTLRSPLFSISSRQQT